MENEEKDLLRRLRSTFDDFWFGPIGAAWLGFLLPLLQVILLTLKYTGTLTAPYIQLCIPSFTACLLWAIIYKARWERLYSYDSAFLQKLLRHSELLSPEVMERRLCWTVRWRSTYFITLPFYIMEPWVRYGMLVASVFIPLHADGLISGPFIAIIFPCILAPWVLIAAFEYHGRERAVWKHPFHSRLHVFTAWSSEIRFFIYVAWVQVLLITLKMDGSAISGFSLLSPAWIATALSFVYHLGVYPKMFIRLESTYLRVVPAFICCTGSFVVWSLFLAELGARIDGYSALGFSTTENRGHFFFLIGILWASSAVALGAVGFGNRDEDILMRMSSEAFELRRIPPSESYANHGKRIRDCELTIIPPKDVLNGQPQSSANNATPNASTSECIVCLTNPKQLSWDADGPICCCRECDTLLSIQRQIAHQLIRIGILHHSSCHAVQAACGCEEKVDNDTALFIGRKITTKELRPLIKINEILSVEGLFSLVIDYYGIHTNWLPLDQLWNSTARVFGRDVEIYSSERLPFMSRYRGPAECTDYPSRIPLRLSEFKTDYRSLARVTLPGEGWCWRFRRLPWRTQGICLLVTYTVLGLTLGLYTSSDAELIASYVLGLLAVVSCFTYQILNWMPIPVLENYLRAHPRQVSDRAWTVILITMLLCLLTLVGIITNNVKGELIALYVLGFVGNYWAWLSPPGCSDSGEEEVPRADAGTPMDVVLQINATYGSLSDQKDPIPNQRPEWKEVPDKSDRKLFKTPHERCLYLWCDTSITNTDSNYEPGCTRFRLLRVVAILLGWSFMVWLFAISVNVSVHAPLSVEIPITNTFNNTVPSPFVHQPWSFMMNPRCQHAEMMAAFYEMTVFNNETSCWPQPLYMDGCATEGHGADGYFYPMLFLVIASVLFTYFYLILCAAPVVYDTYLHPPKDKKCDCGSGIVAARPQLRCCSSPVFAGVFLLVVGAITSLVFTGTLRTSSDIGWCAPRLQNEISGSWNSDSGCISNLKTLEQRKLASEIAQDCPGTFLHPPSNSEQLFVQLSPSSEVRLPSPCAFMPTSCCLRFKIRYQTFGPERKIYRKQFCICPFFVLCLLIGLDVALALALAMDISILSIPRSFGK